MLSGVFLFGISGFVYFEFEFEFNIFYKIVVVFLKFNLKINKL